MRVAWIIYGPLEQTTGGYIYDRALVLGLRAMGDEVRVLSLPPPPAGLADAAQALVEAVREGDFDVVVGDELCFRELGPAFEELASDAAEESANRPESARSRGHERDPKSGPLRVLLVHHLARWEGCGGPEREAEERALTAAKLCVTTSEASTRRLVDEGCAAPVLTVEPGADRLATFVHGRAASSLGAELLFVGNLVPRKEVPALLVAFEAGAALGTRLVIAGDDGRDPAHAAAVRAAVASSARLTAAVELRGKLDDDALAEALARADALVLPSALEGYGMVLTEAVAAGTPVICTTGSPAATRLAAAGAALVVPAGDGAALAGALAAFTSDPALRARLSAAAAAIAPELPRWSDAVSRFRALLMQVMRLPRTAPAAPAAAPR